MVATGIGPRPAGSALGVDIGGTNIKWVHRADAAVVARGTLPTPAAGPAQVAVAIAEVAAARTVEAIGVALPGHLSPELRATTTIPNIDGDWQGFPLADTLERATAKPVLLMNDARAFASAELALGSARGHSDVVFMTMGTGIGGAIALGGTVLRGPGDRIGEIGHMTAAPGGDRCGCGARGCLETVAGGRALATAWSRALASRGNGNGNRSRSRNEDRSTANQGRSATPEDLVEAARSGDTTARKILDSAALAVGTALGSVLAQLGLSTVVVGGGVAPAFDLMRPAVESALRDRRRLIGPVTLLAAALGPYAGAMGAALNATAQTLAAPSPSALPRLSAI
ncbi:ROK family protein [Streptomyces sp. DSM 40750]|uniref:ROK family protein n=1 Tax=Streptomyces sp. DSM 40750 TaxID=2801030 RepID=UPI00214BDFC2|nr:ROK family protein [Streptomyces sp. DSM 40750]UUU20219.1 ROK family protein [Streptomyces sp. DSM 40750]